MLDISQPSLHLSLLSVILSPLFWTLVARNEFRNHTLSNHFKAKELACSLFALSVFSLSLLRDLLFAVAMRRQPVLGWPEEVKMAAIGPLTAILQTSIVYIGFISFLVGSILVSSSMFRLGIHGTYLVLLSLIQGDHFGILKREKVKGFPFNTCKHPMYYGSTLCFVGTALMHSSFAGVVLSCVVGAVYSVAIYVEEPFTEMIYKELESVNGKQEIGEGKANGKEE